MARARNIKPGFFANEYLADLPFEARLLFIGLWTLCDRRGRLEDRPKGIKGRLFPYDDIDIDELLQSLSDSPERFIIRYSISGNRYIQVSNFEKHQNPHCKEPESTIPPPPALMQDIDDASTIQTPCKHSSSTADSLNLIPDTPLLIPDIPIEAEASSSAKPQSEIESEGQQKNNIDYKAIVQLFNTTCTTLPQVRCLTDKRRGAIKARFTDKDSPATFETFSTVFDLVEQSDFLSGRNGKWKACCFDWVLKPGNWTRIIEGSYNRESKTSARNDYTNTTRYENQTW